MTTEFKLIALKESEKFLLIEQQENLIAGFEEELIQGYNDGSFDANEIKRRSKGLKKMRSELKRMKKGFKLVKI